MLWKIGFDPTACNMTCSRRLRLKNDFDDNIDALMQREVSQQLCADDEAFRVQPTRGLDREYCLYMFLVATWFLVVPFLLGILIRRYCGTASFECSSENGDNVATEEGFFYRSVCRGIIWYEYASEAIWAIIVFVVLLAFAPHTERAIDKPHTEEPGWWQYFVVEPVQDFYQEDRKLWALSLYVLPALGVWLKRKLIDALLDATSFGRPELDDDTDHPKHDLFSLLADLLAGYITIKIFISLFTGEPMLNWPPECL